MGHLTRLKEAIKDPKSCLLLLAGDTCRDPPHQIAHPATRTNAMKKTIDTVSKAAEISRRLQTIPGMGPISALAVETLHRQWNSQTRAQFCGLARARAAAELDRRQAAAREDLEDGQRDIRRLLIKGAMAVRAERL